MVRVMLDKNLTGKLSRYEVTLQNQLSQTIRELRTLRARRYSIFSRTVPLKHRVTCAL